MLVLDDSPEYGRHLQPTLVVDPGRSAASKAPFLHFTPKKSTRIVRLREGDVNRKLLM